jgi:2-haloacid dehalogenase
MASSIEVLVFDVNETLSDMASMGERFAEVGARPELARLWFATLLRDGFALAASGDAARFGDIGSAVLAALFRAEGVADPAATATRLASAVAELPLHTDVVVGIQALHRAGHRLVTLSNGSAQVAEQLFGAAGIRGEFERLLTVEDAPAWKPHPAAYRYAAEQCGTREQEMLLVAVHPWDIHGAARAGLRTAWVTRTQASYPSYYARPDLTVDSLTDLAPALAHGS